MPARRRALVAVTARSLAATLLCLLAARAAPATQSSPLPPALARVEVSGPVAGLGLPVLAHLVDETGREYLLVVATPDELDAAGARYTILDPIGAPEGYVLADRRSAAGRTRRAAGEPPVVCDDGRHVVLRRREAEASGPGFLAPLRPLTLRSPITPPRATDLTYDTLVADMVAAVSQSNLVSICRQLSGEDPATIGGAAYTISTRYTNSGAPIAMATQYASERFAGAGLAPSYHNWSYGSISGRNVVAEIPGAAQADELVLVTAHIDDVPAGSPAPGADDNASGSTAVLTVAEILAGYRFARTVRFVLFTGEEQGLYGSDRYAQVLADAGADVVAVLNLDMIAWEGDDDPVLNLHLRPFYNPGYWADLEIATTFVDAVILYGLGGQLAPDTLGDGNPYSDHASFWLRGYPGILAIEDDGGDFNAYYHTTNDRISHFDLDYFTAFVRAAVATAAHLAIPISTACPTPEVPTLTAPSTTASGVPYVASWTATSPDDAYALEDDLDPGFADPGHRLLAATQVTVTRTVGADTDLHVRVRALEECGGMGYESAWSETATTTVAAAGDCGVVLSERSVAGTELVESCGGIAVGPNLTVSSSGRLELLAATSVVLRNGVSIAPGSAVVITAGTTSP